MKSKKDDGFPYYRLVDTGNYPSKEIKDFVKRRVGGLAEHSQCQRPLIDLLANAYVLGMQDTLDLLKHKGEIE